MCFVPHPFFFFFFLGGGGGGGGGMGEMVEICAVQNKINFVHLNIYFNEE